jgi:hypothetical protein
LRRGVFLGLLTGAAYAAWRFVATRQQDGVTFEPAPFLSPPRPVPTPSTGLSSVPGDGQADGRSNGSAWVDPVDGTCPVSHPVKAKMSSGIYHLPGGGNYDRTHADRCYASADDAESDGLRAAKR